MSFSNPLLKKYRFLALQGIVVDNFVGEDIRYSADFETIESILAEATSMFGNAVVDWQAVIDLSEKILKEQSKDLRVLSWFTWGLFKTSSFAGLHAGINILNELVSSHWDAIYPSKDRTRVSAIDWLATKIEQQFVEPIPVKDQLPLFKALLAELLRLDQFLTEKWDDKSPLLLPTCRRIERMIEEAAKDHVEPNAVEKVITQVKEVVNNAIGVSSAPSTLENEREANKILRNLQDSSRTLCSWWLSQRSTDIKALRLNRSLLWIAIESVPDHKDNITTLRPVPVDKVNNYKERLSQGRYTDLIVDLESSISRAPFWLDGQYMVWQCLHALNMDAAMLEIEVQTALFLQRIPSIIELKFHDGTPFASENTVCWINDHVTSRLGQHGQMSSNIIAGFSVPQKWDEVLQECIESLPRDGLKDSMKPLAEGLQTASGGRESFFWHLSMAKLCFANKKYELAKTQLESLDEQMQQAGIQNWEPALALEIVYLLYRCCELLPQAQLVRETKEKLYKRLCFLDINLILDEN